MKKTSDTLTLRQVAKLARTSKSTVSRVLTKHPSVSPKTRARIEAVIAKHGFRPNLFARGLAGGRTGLVAVLASEMNSGFYAEVIRGIDEVAGQHDGHILTSFSHGIPDYTRLWHELATEGRVDGVILIAPPIEIMAAPIDDDSVPAVLCACRAPKHRKVWAGVDSVSVDNEKGMEELLRHLAEQGCRHLVHIAGPENMYDGVERRRAFERFIKSMPGLQGDVIYSALNREGGRAAALQYLAGRATWPDAFVSFNDSTALGVLEALREVGSSVPKPVAVTGCDDEPSSAFVGLTTLHMPMLELGRETARLLFERMERKGEDVPARASVIELSLKIRHTSLIGKAPVR
jgi:LacI family transcriptional regulator